MKKINVVLFLILTVNTTFSMYRFQSGLRRSRRMFPVKGKKQIKRLYTHQNTPGTTTPINIVAKKNYFPQLGQKKDFLTQLSVRFKKWWRGMSELELLLESIDTGNTKAFLELFNPKNVNAKINGKTLLDYATKSNEPEIVEMLLENGADVNVKSNEGMTPLFFACHSGNSNTVEMFMVHDTFQDD